MAKFSDESLFSHYLPDLQWQNIFSSLLHIQLVLKYYVLQDTLTVAKFSDESLFSYYLPDL